MTEETEVVIRDFYPEKDQAFIYSSWRNQAYYSAVTRPAGNPSKFFRNQSHKIMNILENAQVRVACLYDSPIVIIGYSVFTGPHLDWVYVKDDYRRKGIGSLLVPKTIQTFTNQLTKIGQAIVKKKNLTTTGENNNGNSYNPNNQESYAEKVLQHAYDGATNVD